MEFVGKAVKKKFLGFGVYSGVVESYDPSAGYFKVLYEDGDTEEVDSGEIAAMLMGMGEDALETKQTSGRKRGRPPRNRRGSEMDEGQVCVGEDVDLGGGKSSICESGVVRQNGGLKGYDGTSSGLYEESCHFDVLQVGENGDFAGKDVNGMVSEGRGAYDNGGIDVNESVDRNCTPNSFAVMGSSGCNLKRHLEEIKHKEMRKINFGNDNVDAHCPEDVDTCGNSSMEGSKRRRRGSAKINSFSETPLRRSTRNASSNALLDDGVAYSVKGSVASESTDVETELFTEIPKPELPPSSKDLELDELPILDFFSVYAFLRSFSRVLFLSPFSIQTFLTALRCKNANTLVDAIHFSILQVLRRHLKFLSQEGSDSATYRLRSLNWDLLDLATWPVYLFEYILFHGPTLKSLFKNSHSNLLNGEYYMLPAGLKLEILRCLCDDILESETLRPELCLRMTQVDVEVDSWHIMTNKWNESRLNGVADESGDGNSDECILCGMDGSLICCDGCPAAFHSKCVGVAQELLPEGDWYCPECLIDKSDGLSKFLKSSRGAEIVGTDPHGRLYFSSCDYLLVLDSCETISSSNFYNKDDLNFLIRTLKLSHASYDIIANAISICWGILADTSVCKIQPRAAMTDIVKVIDAKLDSEKFLTSYQTVIDDYIVAKQPKDLKFPDDGCVGTCASSLNQSNLRSFGDSLGMVSLHEVCEQKGEMACVVESVNLPQQVSIDCSIAGNLANEDCSSKSVNVAFQKKNSFEIGGWISKESSMKEGKDSILHQQSHPVKYVNYYIFGLLASFVAKELLVKPAESNCKESRLVDDFISRQVKAISKISSNLCRHSCLNLSLEVLKERCGWCFSCKTTGSNECVFRLLDSKTLENSKSRLVDLHSEKKRKSHLGSAIQLLISIEDQLRGFLSGPWDRPNYSNQWRKAVSKASQVTTLGHMLLILELNLRRVALSPDWTKIIDSTDKVGSGSCILSGPVDFSTNCNGNRKQGKRSFANFGFSQADFASYICWWRGGRLSRQVFHWRMLPKSLARKSARQAGCKRIPILTYPDGLDFPRISKFVAWRAAVEMSRTVSQLIFQIKEFDSHIRWSEFSKISPVLQLTKESKTYERLFKKVIIRTRRTEGESIQYLLDFGKRQNTPPIVIKYGVELEDPSCDRKKFWLGEPYVPLYLVKSYEERKIARSLKRSETKLPSESANNCILEKTKKLKGLSYLMSKSDKVEIEVCIQCNKDVLIREAMVCQECQGLFHKKHFKIPKDSLSAKNICCSCKSKETGKFTLKKQDNAIFIIEKREAVKFISKKKGGAKLVLEKKETAESVLESGNTMKWLSKRKRTSKSKNSLQKKDLDKKKISDSTWTMVLRKKRKCVFVKSKKRTYGTKQSKRSKPKSTQSRKSDSMRISSKRKRTTRDSVIWLNGLLWSRKPDDKRGESFRNKRLQLPSQNVETTAPLPACCVCLKEYKPGYIYVGCESCYDWFHGDIFNLSTENLNFLIGFKCPKCRAKSIPSCPFSLQSAIAESKSPTKLSLAGSVVHEYQKCDENYEGETFAGHSAVHVQHSSNQEMVDKIKEDEQMEELKSELENKIYDHLPFVSPSVVENQHSLEKEKDCNVGIDEDMPDVEVLKAEPDNESHDRLVSKPLTTVHNQHLRDQEKDGNVDDGAITLKHIYDNFMTTVPDKIGKDENVIEISKLLVSDSNNHTA